MASVFQGALPPLPLLLWEAPPALEQVLDQEGIAYRTIREPNPLAFGAGRFVLFDGRRAASAKLRGLLSPQHRALDLDLIRREGRDDPFRDLLETRAARVRWEVGGLGLTERVARHPRAEIRRRLVDRLGEAIVRAGGIWARLAPFPFPYRSAFNLRVDLDEHAPDDYRRFAAARRPLDDCTTHFLNTHAYGQATGVLDDLQGLDVQSHAHYHVVYRSEAANRRNLGRAHEVLLRAGFDPIGFAGPEGRWNPGLDAALERAGYAYSSDFQVGYDDLPFFPWRGDRPSGVLQVPVHPICEGLFLQAGADGRAVAGYLAGVVRDKVRAGEPAFVYGHPEGRLGRMPEVLEALAAEVDRHALLWRVTLTEFARWWRWRAGRSWSIEPREGGRFEVQFDDWDDRYPLALEVRRGRHSARFPIQGPRTSIRLDDLAYERQGGRADLPRPEILPPRRGWKAAVRSAIDWETVTPVDDLPESTAPERIKKHLRRWKDARTHARLEVT